MGSIASAERPEPEGRGNRSPSSRNMTSNFINESNSLLRKNCRSTRLKRRKSWCCWKGSWRRKDWQRWKWRKETRRRKRGRTMGRMAMTMRTVSVVVEEEVVVVGKVEERKRKET